MKPTPRRLLPLLCLAWLAACSDDPTSPAPGSLVGDWDLVGFADGGVEATVSGTASFREDGSFSIVGTVGFPGEPTDAITISGTYEVDGTVVTLQVGADRSVWNLSFPVENRAVLTEDEPPPANRISLERA